MVQSSVSVVTLAIVSYGHSGIDSFDWLSLFL